MVFDVLLFYLRKMEIVIVLLKPSTYLKFRISTLKNVLDIF